jgi:hypothetical protein
VNLLNPLPESADSNPLWRSQAKAGMEDFVEKWPFEGAVPHWVALESRTCSGVSHSAASRRLNKLRTPHCWSFFDKVMETCPTAGSQSAI